DGISATEGRVVFMTTNHRDALDQALIRPGRADVHVYIGNATAEQARQLFLRCFPGRVAEAQAFTELLGSERYSMAEQEYTRSTDREGEPALAWAGRGRSGRTTRLGLGI